MIIDCISDLHGFYPELEGGDLLIVAGDLTAADNAWQYVEFGIWLNKQKYKNKIVIAGNHDNIAEKAFPFIDPGTDEWTYLCDSGTEFSYHIDGFPEEDEGFLPSGKRTLKIWGSPWTLRFPGMNPQCMAFTLDTEEELAERWALIPNDVDILITHSPPFSVCDLTIDGLQVGSSSLMGEHIFRLRPKLWVFGHIHEAYGQDGPYQWNDTKYVNASYVNENYKPLNKPIRIIF